MTLYLYLLGPLAAQWGPDQALNLTSTKAQALLAYLAMEGDRRHHREALAGLLWPNQPSELARGSLRQALQVLRQALGDATATTPCLLVTRDTIRFNPAADCWLDVAALQALAALAAARPSGQHDAATLARLGAVSDFYRGPLLAEFALDDSPAFEEWLLLKREQCHRQALQVLASAAAGWEQGCDYEQALACVQRIVALEPWHEAAHRQTMRLLARLGRRAEAIAHYRHCRAQLQRELQVEPEGETTALYERLRAGGPLSPTPAAAHPAQPAVLAGPHLAPAPLHAEALLPPLVAREQELARLGGLLSRALAGEGGIIPITGEAGSGKTALLTGFGRQALESTPGLLLALGRCSAHLEAGDPYQPWRELLHSLTGDPELVVSAVQAQRLQAALPVTMAALVTHGPDLALLLARNDSFLARAEACAPRGAPWWARLQALLSQADQPATFERQPISLNEQMAQFLRALTQSWPLLIALDDLQWADAYSLDLLTYLGAHLRGCRLLLVGAWRPPTSSTLASPEHRALAGLTHAFQRRWGEAPIDLALAQGRRFVDAYLDSWPNRLGPDFRQALAHHTGGNALFTVELVRALQERGQLRRNSAGHWIEGPGLSWSHVPPRIEGAIAQRLGELTASQRELLTIASVEGDVFQVEVLARVSGLAPQAIIAELSGPLGREGRLVTAAGLVPVGAQQLTRYRFRHGLFQRGLYGLLDEGARAHYHGLVGEALEALYGDQAAPLALRLAQHFTIAGQPQQAASYLLQAGREAVRVGAPREGVANYERALALLAPLPGTAARLELEYALQLALDHALLFGAGWGAAERGRVLGRVEALSQRLPFPAAARLRTLRELAELRMAQGELDTALNLAQELLAQATLLHDVLYTAAAHVLLGVGLTMQGRLPDATAHTSLALDFMATPRAWPADEFKLFYPHTHIAAATVALAEGRPLEARQRIDEALATDRWTTPQRAGMHSLAALYFAFAHQDELATQQAQQALQIVGEHTMPDFTAWSQLVLTWALARAGQPRAPTTSQAAAWAAEQRLGLYGIQMVLLIETLLAEGQAALALSITTRALAQMEVIGARFAEAEIWRLRGEALRLEGQAVEAAACWRRALEIARGQGARLWEQRVLESQSGGVGGRHVAPLEGGNAPQ